MVRPRLGHGAHELLAPGFAAKDENRGIAGEVQAAPMLGLCPGYARTRGARLRWGRARRTCGQSVRGTRPARRWLGCRRRGSRKRTTASLGGSGRARVRALAIDEATARRRAGLGGEARACQNVLV